MSLTCGKCDNGWICEEHPDQPWPHDDCSGPGMPCEVPTCPYRIDLRPVQTYSGLVCPSCRQPVATVERESIRIAVRVSGVRKPMVRRITGIEAALRREMSSGTWEDRVTPRPPREPRLDLIEVYWRVVGPSESVMECAIYRTDVGLRRARGLQHERRAPDSIAVRTRDRHGTEHCRVSWKSRPPLAP
jgi:hypothetical protein